MTRRIHAGTGKLIIGLELDQPGLLFVLGGLVGVASDKVSAGILVAIGMVLFVLSFLLLSRFGETYLDFLGLQGILFSISDALL